VQDEAMYEQTDFADFIRRIRAGDERAAEELVRKYEALIRREVRLHLEDRRLGRLFDSMDICQSVLASFFVRTAAGQYELERPEQVLKLLVTMARNKLASAARSEHRQCRDNRRTAGDKPAGLESVAATGPSPSEQLAGKELLERVRQALSHEERQLVELRSQDRTWADIAAQLGGTAQGRRMQLTRALERVAQQIGLDEPSHA
jgi:RNA polymerase sigma-70 factor (ECF subfamily)